MVSVSTVVRSRRGDVVDISEKDILQWRESVPASTVVRSRSGVVVVVCTEKMEKIAFHNLPLTEFPPG